MSIGKTIAVENSTWNNIGDAFYQISLLTLLRELFPEKRVVSFDGPIVRAFRPGRHSHFAFDSRFMCNADHYVFSGPILGGSFLSNYGPLIVDIERRGRTYSLLSIHTSSDKGMLEEIKTFLYTHPPVAIHTRDSQTFKKLSDLPSLSLYDGMCFAFFVNKIDDLPDMSGGEPYVCSSYYSMPEPDFENIETDVFEIAKSGVQLRYRGSRFWRVKRHFEYLQAHPITHKSKFPNKINIVYDYN